MGNYVYLKKIKANGNLPVAIIDFLSTRATYFRFKNGDIREGQNICCQKSIFRLNRLFKQLFSCFE